MGQQNMQMFRLDLATRKTQSGLQNIALEASNATREFDANLKKQKWKTFYNVNTIGVKNEFLYINICWVPREVLKTLACNVKVSTPLEGPSRCKSIRKTCEIVISRATQTRWRKSFQKFCRSLAMMPRNVTLSVCVLKKPLPGQMITSFWRHYITCTNDCR